MSQPPRHRFVTTWLLLVLLVPALSASPSASAQTNGITTILGTGALNIRSCPALSCDVIASVPLDTRVGVVGDSVNGFVPVVWKSHQGWAYDLFLFTEGEDRYVRSGRPGCNRVAIMFNAGIGDAPSQDILEFLVSSGTPATLFAMGWWAEAYPDYLNAMDDAGVVIGSHGNTQTFLTGASDEQVRAEVRDSAARIEAVVGYPPTRYYTPYATDSDERVRRIIAEEGYLPVGWSVAGVDFNGDDTAQAVYSNVTSGVSDGAIIELHLDGPATERSTAVALPWIVADLKAQGYELVTVPEIILPCP